MAFLNYQGIGTGIHYPIPLHLQKAYQHLGYQEGDFPICERAAREIVSLPMFPQLRPDQQQRVVQAVAEFLENRSHRSPLQPERCVARPPWRASPERSHFI
jgi:dTDP-4-amino-4,6-dideoxygalactose transaminase